MRFEMKKIAMLPGSYDPVTLGHVDVIRRAARIFDSVHAVVMINAEKAGSGMFLPDERLEILRCACRDIPNVKCALCCGLASDYAEENGVSFIAKGIRNPTDFDYEYGLAQIMKKFSEGIETIFLPADPSYLYISSTYARERIRHGCDLSDVADAETASLIEEIFRKK